MSRRRLLPSMACDQLQFSIGQPRGASRRSQSLCKNSVHARSAQSRGQGDSLDRDPRVSHGVHGVTDGAAAFLVQQLQGQQSARKRSRALACRARASRNQRRPGDASQSGLRERVVSHDHAGAVATARMQAPLPAACHPATKLRSLRSRPACRCPVHLPLGREWRESSKQSCSQPDSGVYSIETSGARPPPNSAACAQGSEDPYSFQPRRPRAARGNGS
jgi:hypothetical protein